MAQREKRSVSLPAELAAAVDDAAAQEGTTFSAWLSAAADRRLQIDAGLRGVAAWEADHGPLTDGERAEGLDRARRLLAASAASKGPT